MQLWGHLEGLASDQLSMAGCFGDSPHPTASEDPQEVLEKAIQGCGGRGHSCGHRVGPDKHVQSASHAPAMLPLDARHRAQCGGYEDRWTRTPIAQASVRKRHPESPRHWGALEEGASLAAGRRAGGWLAARPRLPRAGRPLAAGAVPSATTGCCRPGRLTEAGHRSLNREQNMVSVYYQSR